MENELIKMIEEMLFDNKAVGGIMPNTAKKANNLIKKVREGKKEQESTEALHKHGVSHSSLQNLKTYWVNYENEWQPTKTHTPFENAPLYFKFFNGMLVECNHIEEWNIKELCYCG